MSWKVQVQEIKNKMGIEHQMQWTSKKQFLFKKPKEHILWNTCQPTNPKKEYNKQNHCCASTKLNKSTTMVNAVLEEKTKATREPHEQQRDDEEG